MCREASFVIVKGFKCYWSKNTDSHSAIRAEFGLPENGVGRVTSVQVEIVPPREHAYDAPASEWVFGVDQDALPSWWDAAEAEAQARLALQDWIAAKVVLSGQSREVSEGSVFVVGTGHVTAYNSSTVTAYGSSTVTAYNSSTVTACDSSTVTACDSSTVTEASGRASVVTDHAFAVACKLTGPFATLVTKFGEKPQMYTGTVKGKAVQL